MIDFEEIASFFLAVMVGVAIALALLAAVYVVLVLFVPFLRARLSALKILAIDTSALRPDQLAAISELEAFGFLKFASAAVQLGPLIHLTFFFKHQDSRAFAALTLSRSTTAGFPVLFYSFGANGQIVVTGNRMEWSIVEKPPQISLADPYAANLANHWQAHLARIAQTPPVELAEAEAQDRALSTAVSYFQSLKDNRWIVDDNGSWRPSWQMAFRQTLNYSRKLLKLLPSYKSLAMNDEHQAAQLFASYQDAEALQANSSTPLRTKAWILGTSIAVSFVLWGLMLGWGLAAVLMVVLAVHETGHAVAMWAFGYRNIGMVFVPLIGAAVTGTPSEIPAWKQAVMLLAGPVPGLLAGAAGFVYLMQYPHHPVGIDWLKISIFAMVINFLNLLPITPLDGGRLLEVGLFNRWPRARLTFVFVSVALLTTYALWQKGDYGLLFLCVFLLAGLITQTRIAKLQRAWKDGLSDDEQAAHLLEVARASFRSPTPAALRPVVKAVFTMRKVRMPRLWESTTILAVLLALWSGAAAGVYAFRHYRPIASAAAAKPPVKNQVTTNSVANDQLKTNSPLITRCKDEWDPLKAQAVCKDLLDKGQLDAASILMAYDKLAGHLEQWRFRPEVGRLTG